MSTQSTETDGKPNDFSSKWRQLRACARCHRLKMRCSYDDPTYTSCRRCFAAGVECSVIKDPTSANAKKRARTKSEKDHLTTLQANLKELFESFLQDKSDKDNNAPPSKKVKLEDDSSNNIEKIYDIQNQLTELQQFLSHVLEQKTSKAMDHSASSSSINSMKDGPVRAIPKYPSIPFQYNIMKELLKLRLLTKQDSQTRFKKFLNEMLCYWPNVSLPANYSDFDYLLENRPLVLLSCISVTALNEPNLHDLMLYYLERNLAQRVCITGDLSVDLIYVYIILSLWSSPPRKWGSFKHQMNLMMALNISLCLESPNEKLRSSQKVLETNSEERKLVRCYISVFCSCGSLGLSLPKFKMVSWNKNVSGCCDVLLQGESSRADKFLHYYAKMIGLGQDIYNYFSSGTSINQLRLGDTIESYEKKLQEIVQESKLFTGNSKERFLLFIIYYQLLMTMHDYVVCDVVKGHSVVIGEVYLESVSRLIRSSEKVVDSFVKLCEETAEFPTFFYYRPMHALVALIRARLLVSLEKLDVDINVQREYDRVKDCLALISDKSLVAKRMSMILTRVEKWMQLSISFNQEGATTSMEVLLGELGEERVGVENLKPPSMVKAEEVTETDKALQDFFTGIDQDMANFQFMKDQAGIDDVALDAFELHKMDDILDNSQLSEFMGNPETYNLFFNLEATGEISRNNST